MPFTAGVKIIIFYIQKQHCEHKDGRIRILILGQNPKYTGCQCVA